MLFLDWWWLRGYFFHRCLCLCFGLRLSLRLLRCCLLRCGWLRLRLHLRLWLGRCWLLRFCEFGFMEFLELHAAEIAGAVAIVLAMTPHHGTSHYFCVNCFVFRSRTAQ